MLVITSRGDSFLQAVFGVVSLFTSVSVIGAEKKKVFWL